MSAPGMLGGLCDLRVDMLANVMSFLGVAPLATMATPNRLLCQISSSHERWRWFVSQVFGVYYDDYVFLFASDDFRWRHLFLHIRQKLDAGGEFRAVADYDAQEYEMQPERGYLALQQGQRVKVQQGTRQPGHAANRYAQYVFGSVERGVGASHPYLESSAGWIPVQFLAGQQALDAGGEFRAAADYNAQEYKAYGRQLGYLALQQGQRVKIRQGTRQPGHAANQYAEYVFGSADAKRRGPGSPAPPPACRWIGWVPVQRLAVL